MDTSIIVTIVIYCLSTSIGAFIFIMNLKSDIRVLQGINTEHSINYNQFKSETQATNRDILTELKKISELGIELREGKKEAERRFEQIEREFETMNTNIKQFYEKYSHLFAQK